MCLGCGTGCDPACLRDGDSGIKANSPRWVARNSPRWVARIMMMTIRATCDIASSSLLPAACCGLLLTSKQDAADRLALARRPMAARQGTREFVRGRIGSMPFTPGGRKRGMRDVSFGCPSSRGSRMPCSALGSLLPLNYQQVPSTCLPSLSLPQAVLLGTLPATLRQLLPQPKQPPVRGLRS